jgi:hypothetical protein
MHFRKICFFRSKTIAVFVEKDVQALLTVVDLQVMLHCLERIAGTFLLPPVHFPPPRSDAVFV